MNMTAQVQTKPAPTPSFAPVRTNLLQRRCACGGTPGPTGECAECRKKRLQRRSSEQTASTASGTTVPPIVHDVLRSPGQPLDTNTRAYMEPRFGHDFSRVRVHTDVKAAESARSVNALAYTVGRDVVFGAGRYAPETTAGRRLLAHELTHAVQQSTATQDVQSKLEVANPTDTAEQEAEMGSQTIAQGGRFVVEPKEAIRIARQEAPEPVASLAPKRWRVHSPTSPGWASVSPAYFLVKSGEPFEFPHFLEVEENSAFGYTKNVTALEGRYKGKDASLYAGALTTVAPANPAARAKYDIVAGQFWYGGKGPIAATTHSTNPTPRGTHDIEIPDFQHKLGARYGDFGTTWFRLGHSGDRYLHPGRVSLGCTTITATSEWPSIWGYLISARKGDQSVGELEVV